MATLDIRVRYRPLRIGWCVRSGNFRHLHKVLRRTHTLWGGRYNPVIPVGGTGFCEHLVELFRVDVLVAAGGDAMIREFVERFPHLRWHPAEKGLFAGGEGDASPALLDLQHAVLRLRSAYDENRRKRRTAVKLLAWNSNDPLATVFLSTFGGFPRKSETGIDYAAILRNTLGAEKEKLDAAGAVPPDACKWVFPSQITKLLLDGNRPSGWSEPGLYFGHCRDFDDIVNYWNLRAANIDLLFYDPALPERLDPLRDAYVRMVRKGFGDSRGGAIAVWTKGSSAAEEFCAKKATDSVLCAVEPQLWNGLNVKPPLVHFKEHSVTGSLSRRDGLQLTLQMPRAPFSSDAALSDQHIVASIRPTVDAYDDPWRFRLPHLPELNDYYGRNCCPGHALARSQPDGLGILTRVGQDRLTLNALKAAELVQKLFGVFGTRVDTTRGGRICARLIRQMGGLNGCRVFIVRGVRRMIAEHNLREAFTKSAAVEIIGEVDPVTGRAHFGRYENLRLETASVRDRTAPEDVFTYLVEKGVFRTGLDLACPHCELTFWRALDDITSESRCEYCGNGFNASGQLKDRDWRYRCSSLLGGDDDKRANLAAVVALGHLDAALGSDMMYAAAMELAPGAVGNKAARVDLVVLGPTFDGRMQIVLGRCSLNDEITQQDAEDLAAVAEALPEERFSVFPLFVKLAGFSSDEIRRCKSASRQKDRVILLAESELDAPSKPDRVHEGPALPGGVDSLVGMAHATRRLYFRPGRK